MRERWGTRLWSLSSLLTSAFRDDPVHVPLQKCPTGGLHQSTQILRANPFSVTHLHVRKHRCYSFSTPATTTGTKQTRRHPITHTHPHTPTYTHTHVLQFIIPLFKIGVFRWELFYLFLLKKLVIFFLLVLCRVWIALFGFSRVYRDIYRTLTVAFMLFFVPRIWEHFSD